MTVKPTHDIEDDSHRHAFNCDEVFRRAYTEAIDRDPRPGPAIEAAWKAHDESVDWVYENVPLD